MTALDEVVAVLDTAPDDAPLPLSLLIELRAEAISRPRGFTCWVCVRDWPEAFCAGCGADLTHGRSGT